jgi:hypothetical protein
MSDNLEMESGLQIIDDNPATLDLLGFDAVVAPVVQAIFRGARPDVYQRSGVGDTGWPTK